ncbi:rhomboid family intramembrane serine protease [Planctomyces sp. SH-PL62]|uniref:rhomboid family intramembrane serine protease n=1 Tax=Planctomyces sp. SH-PL62 TaxID=1636152 RepID=UPI00078BDB5B|nr:rhomboid family intramembrane serine protease [Planctomyces sp. SH-PL62]AMV36380.1 Rhomboid protease GlpG [Planctomyces sp. SH-PL62]
MRQIGELPKNFDPDVLEDHLLGLGMKSRFDRRPDGWAVWIIDEDHVARAREELEAYLAAPGDARFRETARAARETRKKEAKLDREFRKNDRDAGELWTAPTFRRRPITTITVAIAIIVFLLQNTAYRVRTVTALSFFDWFKGPPDLRPHQGLTDILAGQVWRLVTPMFLHFSPLHILFNCWWTMTLGTAIELRRGRWKLLALIVGSAVLSNLAEYLYMERLHANPDGTRFYTFGGLSGVNYALFGYVWMMGENHPEEGLRIDSTNTVILLGWLVLCMTGAVGPVANMAHLSGLAVGMALGLLKF